MLKFLRIAVTAFSLTACVLLIALWVRSYRRADSLTYISDNLVLSRIGTACGTFFVGSVDCKTSSDRPDVTDGWEYQEYDSLPLRPKKTWMFTSNADVFVVLIPALFIVVLLLTSAIVPWLRWRFTLRTLLILTALVAVVLAVIVPAF